MRINGSAVLHAAPDAVWAAITDPTVLAGVIPGCQSLTTLGDNRFGLGITLGVASIKGHYTGEIELRDLVVPQSLTLKAAGAGAPGPIDTTVAVTIADNADGSCTLSYDADAAVGGMVGGVGQRVLTGVAKKTAGQFFSAIDGVLTGERPVKSLAVADAPVAAGTTAPTTAAVVPAAPTGPAAVVAPAGRIELLGAALFGALTMAIGVLIGGRLRSRGDAPRR